MARIFFIVLPIKSSEWKFPALSSVSFVKRHEIMNETFVESLTFSSFEKLTFNPAFKANGSNKLNFRLQ